MRPTAVVPHARALAIALAGALLLIVLAPTAALAYTRPPGGRWAVQHMFDETSSGALSLSRDGSSVATLVLVPGETRSDQCGTRPVRLVSRPKIRSWRSANGRYAVAVNPSGLFKPLPAVFQRDGRSVRGRLMLLWDHDGRLVDTGKVELPGDCHLNFHARKGR
jgi:hypothetical protein